MATSLIEYEAIIADTSIFITSATLYLRAFSRADRACLDLALLTSAAD
jgi:hypothetical protein